MEFLPPEVRVQIFERLPVKSLIRCTCVRKSWKSFIEDPSFIDAHLKAQSHDLVLVRTCPEDGPGDGPEDGRKSESYAIHRDDENFTAYAELDFPFTHPYWWCGCFRIIGSYNGVLCITADEPGITHDTYLWNPSIRKFVQLPLPKYTYESYTAFEQELGFGYDAKTKDYKVVRLVQFDSYGYDDAPQPLKVELYSVSTGVWKDISDLASDIKCDLYGRSRQAYFNGAAHWVPIRPSGKIVSFHFGEEVFRCFETPTDILCKFTTPWPLVFRDSFCLLERGNSSIIWRMEEYGNSNSWARWLDIGISAERLVGFRKEGELVFELDGKLYSFDQKKAEGKKMNILTGFSLILWNNIQQGLLPNDPASFGTDVCNYDPNAAPKDLGIRSKVSGDFKKSFYCDGYVESLALYRNRRGHV